MKVGYVRISTKEQNTARQDELMERLGVEKVYTDKVSGKNTDRPELQRMMDFVREGDVVIVESFSRFARNTRDLLDLMDTLKHKGVQFISLKENIDTASTSGKLMLVLFAALAEFERDNLLERQAEGIAIAKQEGRMGRPEIQPCADFAAIVKDWQDGKMTAVEAMKLAGMTKATFYRKVKAIQE